MWIFKRMNCADVSEIKGWPLRPVEPVAAERLKFFICVLMRKCRVTRSSAVAHRQLDPAACQRGVLRFITTISNEIAADVAITPATTNLGSYGSTTHIKAMRPRI